MFNPQAHITKIQGRDYLEVKWRLVWFRDEHPNGTISTLLVEIVDGNAVVHATVSDESGRVLGTGLGTSSSTAAKMGRFVEKAETAAIGRALAHAGFGTQFTGETEGEHLADSPTASPAQDVGAQGVPHWMENERQRKSFWTSAGNLGYDDSEVHATLGVESMYDYPGNAGEALTALAAARNN